MKRQNLLRRKTIHLFTLPLGQGLLRLLDPGHLHFLRSSPSSGSGLLRFSRSQSSPFIAPLGPGHLHFLAPILSIFWLRTAPLLQVPVFSIYCASWTRSSSFRDFDFLHLLAPDYSAHSSVGLLHLSPVYCAYSSCASSFPDSDFLHLLAPDYSAHPGLGLFYQSPVYCAYTSQVFFISWLLDL